MGFQFLASSLNVQPITYPTEATAIPSAAKQTVKLSTALTISNKDA